MKHRRSIHRAALVAGAFILLPHTSPALEIVAGSFGGCGTSGSASYVTTGTAHPGAGQPSGSLSATLCPGPLAVAYQPSLAGEPKAHVVQTGPGTLALVKVPDSPGWSWAQSVDLVSWSALPEAGANPVLVPIQPPRRFFRLEQP